MCIISQQAKVSGTKIFVALSADQTRQLTVYSNRVQTQAGSVMILPVPHPASVQMIDLSAYPKIFDDLEAPFRRPTYTNSADSLCFQERAYLPVEQCGGYNVTIVPSHTLLSRLSEHHFGMVDAQLQALLGTKYPPHFGFVVCALRAEATTYHPIAYSHRSIAPTVFVPTYHVHRHAAGSTLHEEASAEWDHVIYGMDVTFEYRHGTQATVSAENTSLQFDRIPSFAFYRNKPMLTRMSITGYAPNVDVEAMSQIVLLPSRTPLPPMPSHYASNFCVIQ